MPDQDNDYRVGFGHPPRHSQFVKGKSGNPRGRPKEARNGTTAAEAVFDEVVGSTTIKGATKSLTGRAAIYRGLVKEALAGNVGAARQILREYVDLMVQVGKQQPVQTIVRSKRFVALPLIESVEEWEKHAMREQAQLMADCAEDARDR